ncbi:heavy metal translocating P-type ATPase [Thermosynechococcaceae cyanobacterium BACA0444]|uniref:Heavy metal translocating P-type ATPase n=1 Tax=Pseudocalidococcus azoricus BACA0444 TaxID=2918990 RepID=A0AAE4FSU1_9CYAN|nr:heavy metal translocating P-type ATPase [Pseudocalidococcus azoricus]MDS3861560.1 heavy metal translocating P-type ATPase [Pseudocalidococcus azoricus BACA0444]
MLASLLLNTVELTQTLLIPSSTVALKVKGMRCGGCVANVEKQLMQQPGVTSAAVNLVTATAMVAYEPETIQPQALADHLTQAGFPTEVLSRELPITAALLESGESSSHTDVIFVFPHTDLILAIVFLLLSGVGHVQDWLGLSLHHVPGSSILHTMAWHWGLATLALIGPGRGIIRDGWQSLWRGNPTMNTLVGLGAVSSYLASVIAWRVPGLAWECFFDEPVMIIGFILLGRTLEQRARNQASQSLRSLIALQPALAQWLPNPDRTDGLTIPVAQVQGGDWLRVLPGDKLPVDGVVVRGETFVTEAVLTGEARPIAKIPGDSVMAGSLNQASAITIQATACGNETLLGQILTLVTQAQTRKAPIQRLADLIAGYFTYGVLVLAAVTIGFWWGLAPMLLGIAGGTASLLLGLKLGMAVLVVACPCALGLATPTAILVGTSLGAEQGLLIRGGDVLETLHKLTTIVFDKTGTLTWGKLTVQNCIPLAEFDATELLQLAASLEQNYRHPIAQALLSEAKDKNITLLPVTETESIPGLGIKAVWHEQILRVGSLAWLAKEGLEVEQLIKDQNQQNLSVIGLGLDQTIIGLITLQDQLRPDTAQTLESLKKMGLEIHVLTGDSATATHEILAPLNLTENQIQTQLLPTEKVAWIEQQKVAGKTVAMVGDGTNDAPALAGADVGIALASGTDVALETAGIVLTHNRLADVVAAIQLSRATFSKIQQNLAWACGYNLIAIPVAAGVLLPIWQISLTPGLAAACMALSSISVVVNALLLNRVKSSWIWN